MSACCSATSGPVVTKNFGPEETTAEEVEEESAGVTVAGAGEETGELDAETGAAVTEVRASQPDNGSTAARMPVMEI